MDIKILKEEIEKLNSLPRNHAGFFNWHDKEIQEIGIGLDFFQKIEEKSEDYLVDIKNAEDPPDVVIKTNTGRTLGVEITELVDQKAIEYDIKDDPRYAERVVSWDKDKTLNAITEIIRKKEHLCRYVTDNYDELILLIFTDEPKLTSDALKEFIKGYAPPKSPIIDAAYILTSYEPKYGVKSLIRIM